MQSAYEKWSSIKNGTKWCGLTIYPIKAKYHEQAIFALGALSIHRYERPIEERNKTYLSFIFEMSTNKKYVGNEYICNCCVWIILKSLFPEKEINKYYINENSKRLAIAFEDMTDEYFINLIEKTIKETNSISKRRSILIEKGILLITERDMEESDDIPGLRSLILKVNGIELLSDEIDQELWREKKIFDRKKQSHMELSNDYLELLTGISVITKMSIEELFEKTMVEIDMLERTIDRLIRFTLLSMPGKMFKEGYKNPYPDWRYAKATHGYEMFGGKERIITEKEINNVAKI
jgi:hypothetical protein